MNIRNGWCEWTTSQAFAAPYDSLTCAGTVGSEESSVEAAEGESWCCQCAGNGGDPSYCLWRAAKLLAIFESGIYIRISLGLQCNKTATANH